MEAPARHSPPTLDELLQIRDNQAAFDHLVELLRNESIFPFIGAGLSMPCGFPGWRGFLLDEAKKANCLDEVRTRLDEGRYEEAADVLEEKLDSFAFNHRIKETFGERALAKKTIRGTVVYLPRLTHRAVFTTNFDRVLERVFEAQSRPFERAVWGYEFETIGKALYEKHRVLIKVHGDAEESTRRVLTRREYAQHYGEERGGTRFDPRLPLPFLLSHVFKVPLLFLGCSLEQDRTMNVLSGSADDLLGPTHYAIVEEVEDPAARARFLSKHRIIPIWFPAKTYDAVEILVRGLAERLEQVAPPVHVAQVAPPPPGALYLGKTAEQWAAELDAPDARERKQAAWALGQMGAQASGIIPALLRKLRDPESKVVVQVLQSVQRIAPQREDAIPPVVRLLESSDASIVDAAIRFLAHSGSPAIDLLCTELAEDATGPTAARALARIGEPAIGSLVRIATGEGEASRRRALDALCLIGTQGAYLHLRLAFKTASSHLRPLLARYLARLAFTCSRGEVAPEELIPALVLALEDEDRAVRQQAAKLLVDSGGSAVEALRAGLSPTSRAFSEVLAVIKELGTTAAPLLPELLRLYDTSAQAPPLLLPIAETIILVATTTPPSGPVLTALESPHPEIRQAAMKHLSKLGELDLPLLARAVTTLSFEDARRATEAALVAAGPAGVDATRQEFRRNSDFKLLVLFGRFGPAAASAAPEVLDWLGARARLLDKDVAELDMPSVERALGLARSILTLTGEKLLFTLVRRMMDPSVGHRQAAAWALRNLDLVPAAMSHLENFAHGLRAATAIPALVSLGAESAPHLRRLRQANDPETRRLAQEALGKLGLTANARLRKALSFVRKGVLRGVSVLLGIVGAPIGWVVLINADLESLLTVSLFEGSALTGYTMLLGEEPKWGIAFQGVLGGMAASGATVAAVFIDTLIRNRIDRPAPTRRDRTVLGMAAGGLINFLGTYLHWSTPVHAPGWVSAVFGMLVGACVGYLGLSTSAPQGTSSTPSPPA